MPRHNSFIKAEVKICRLCIVKIEKILTVTYRVPVNWETEKKRKETKRNGKKKNEKKTRRKVTKRNEKKRNVKKRKQNSEKRNETKEKEKKRKKRKETKRNEKYGSPSVTQKKYIKFNIIYLPAARRVIWWPLEGLCTNLDFIVTRIKTLLIWCLLLLWYYELEGFSS